MVAVLGMESVATVPKIALRSQVNSVAHMSEIALRIAERSEHRLLGFAHRRLLFAETRRHKMCVHVLAKTTIHLVLRMQTAIRLITLDSATMAKHVSMIKIAAMPGISVDIQLDSVIRRVFAHSNLSFALCNTRLFARAKARHLETVVWPLVQELMSGEMDHAN